MANTYRNAGGDDGRYVIDSKAGRSFGEAQRHRVETRLGTCDATSSKTSFLLVLGAQPLAQRAGAYVKDRRRHQLERPDVRLRVAQLPSKVLKGSRARRNSSVHEHRVRHEREVLELRRGILVPRKGPGQC